MKHKAVQVFYMGQPLRKVYPHATAWQVFKYKSMMLLRTVAITAIMVGTPLMAYWFGQLASSGTVLNYTSVQVAAAKDGIPPVLARIAKAESGNSQIGNDGQVVIHVNTNGTYDIGKYQVNSIWNKTATKMGYNLYVEKDNEAFAIYLFNNYGSEPWNSSKSRWQ